VPPRSLSFAIATTGIAAGTALFLAARETPAPVAPPKLVELGAEIDGRLRESAAGLRSRAATLADLPRLAAAVATDAATVQDLTSEELAFRLKPGETIEIGQIRHGGEAVSLLRIPRESQAAPKLDVAGSALLATPEGFLLSEVVNIKPAVTTEIERGAVAVSWLVETAPFVQKLGEVGVPARIELGQAVIGATPQPIPDGAATVVVKLGTPDAAIIAAPPPPAAGLAPLQLGGIGIAALGVVVAAAMMMMRRRPTTSPGAPPLRAPGGLPPIVTPHSPAAKLATPVRAAQPTLARAFGRYSLVRKLGTGGMAEVYLARVVGEAGFEKDVALKIMHSNLAALPEVVDHFLDEARLASRLAHPNIVQIIDLGRTGDDYFIAMEYIDGYDLDFILENAQTRGALVPARVALAIVRKVCDGLHAAHTAIASDGTPLDLVHRDVKAENVLISRKGEVKVSDFGIAKANQRSRVTQLGMIKGTAAYMAPEHRVGKPVDRRADVYGVGAILYELLTGTEINLDLETLAHLGKEGWPHLTPVSQLRKDLPPDVDGLVFKALAFEREDRYASCAAMEEAIEQFAVRHGLEAGDKTLVQWVEKELLSIEARAAHGAYSS
jgi:hypothetical protein